jgi:hypothetical protein
VTYQQICKLKFERLDLMEWRKPFEDERSTQSAAVDFSP